MIDQRAKTKLRSAEMLELELHKLRHDLRNSLQIVIGYCDVLLGPDVDPLTGAQRWRLETALSAAEKAAARLEVDVTEGSGDEDKRRTNG